eukprot:TRINITY_DN28608_c0_g2_i1.p1 TRINITY_DN28608_c0_g2~~TRINITY_DN28608_c0_g2_i1.p1  ORF type:complete len:394 (+),score=72.08 TRINITY_DN28608_c0_g2_i1:138-1319(+)
MPAPTGSLLQQRKRIGLSVDVGLAKERAAACELASNRFDVVDMNTTYEILGELGRGSRGVVRRARRRNDGRVVALKIAAAADVEEATLTWKEFDILQNIQHPGIIRVFQFFVWQGTAVIEMECFDSSDMWEAVKRQSSGHFSESTTHALFVAQLQAVDYLHRRRIVHRDIKPENVLISTDLSELRLIDFNVARKLCEGAALSPTGSKLYAPPEAAQGEPPSEASDIWGVGLCLHVMLCGKLPDWRRKPGPEWEAHERVVTYVQDVTAACHAVVESCLAERLKRPAAMTLLEAPWTRLGLMVDSCRSEGGKLMRSASDSDLSSLSSKRQSSIGSADASSMKSLGIEKACVRCDSFNIVDEQDSKRPCVFFARGLCTRGASCNFLHVSPCFKMSL